MIYDRPYMTTQRESQQRRLLLWLIGVNVGVFVVQNLEPLMGVRLLEPLFALDREALGRGQIWTFVTYAFLHHPGSLLHILGNMLGLFFLGRALLPVLGSGRFLQLYFASAALGGVVWWLASFFSGAPGVIGASGSVFGLLAMFACLYPNRDIHVLLFFVLPVRVKPKVLALVALGISAFLFLFHELGRGSGYAHSAHLGGMLCGWLFYKRAAGAGPNLAGAGPSIRLPDWLARRKKPAKPVQPYHYKVNLSQPRDVKAEVDRILDKINSKGFGSLSESEKKLLDDAREILRRR